MGFTWDSEKFLGYAEVLWKTQVDEGETQWAARALNQSIPRDV